MAYRRGGGECGGALHRNVRRDRCSICRVKIETFRGGRGWIAVSDGDLCYSVFVAADVSVGLV